jgi:hypothetical protein
MSIYYEFILLNRLKKPLTSIGIFKVLPGGIDNLPLPNPGLAVAIINHRVGSP